VSSINGLSIFGGLLSLLLLSACGGDGREVPPHREPSGAEEDYLVRVGGRDLTLAEFKSFIPGDYQGLLTGPERREFLDRWVDTELLYRGAEASGLLEDPEIQRRLAQQRRDFVANAYLQKTLDERVSVTEAEIGAFFAAHRNDYAWEYWFRQIVVNSREEAEDIHRQLKSGRLGFPRAAELYSLDVSARLGGDMGWVTRAVLSPEVQEHLKGLPVDGFTEPFETTWGWTLVQLRERRQNENALELSELREEILRHLLVEKRRRVHEKLLEELREDFHVDYHPKTEARLGER